MTVIRRPLDYYVINISISESADSRALGFPNSQINRVTLQIVAALLGQGARVLFGHDWREDGVMEAIYNFARQFQAPVLRSPNDRSEPVLLNCLPWPDDPILPRVDLERLAQTLKVWSAGLPIELQQYGASAREGGKNSPLYRYMRARALTHLRHELSSVCDARLCIGGRKKGSAGRYPGIVEEALFAIQASKPLYVAGALGGVSQQVIDALERRKMPSDFCAHTKVASLYMEPPVVEINIGEDQKIFREKVWEEFVRAGVETISERTRLTKQETKELLHTRSIDQVIELVLVSLSRLRAAWKF